MSHITYPCCNKHLSPLYYFYENVLWISALRLLMSSCITANVNGKSAYKLQKLSEGEADVSIFAKGEATHAGKLNRCKFFGPKLILYYTGRGCEMINICTNLYIEDTHI